ncbi:MAG TPA: hemerythrin domain-containing protein [Gaiellaceae bacterium]|nr:hemerythrin domain-containing protein [Gaiellaceae bacterium]
MKRDAALIPLSHDHHHGLVQARRLRRAAADDPARRREAAAAFLAFFAEETRTHFRQEEERFFPLLVDAEAPATELLTRALLEHQRLHALARVLGAQVETGDVSQALMEELADALDEHIRFEERTLFPLMEQVVPEEALRRLQDAPAAVELLEQEGKGPLWGTETEDLNATLLAWPAGGGTSAHVNAERDVLVVVLAGSATVTVDGEALTLDAGQALVVEKGRSRQIAAGPDGVRYLSVHVRRPKLQISPAPAR